MLRKSTQPRHCVREPDWPPSVLGNPARRAGSLARAVLVVFATCAAGAGSASAQILPNWYYETIYVGNGAAPWSNEVAVLSAWSFGFFTAPPQERVATPSGVFADFNTAATPANVVYGAALDSSAAGAAAGFAPTGSLAVAKNIGGINGFETYYSILSPTGVNPTGPANFLTQELVTGTMASYLTPSASNNPIQRLDIANGMITPGAIGNLVTSYVATAEVIGVNIWLGVYGMTNGLGVPVAPYFVNATPTMVAGPCNGLVTSNGRPGMNGLTRNDIVFVDGNNIAHAQSFEIGIGAFPFALDTMTNYPAVNGAGVQLLPANGTVAGIWICQAPPPVVNAHNIGVSMTGPTGAGSHAFNILHDMGAPSPAPGPFGPFFTVVTPFGGGPVCHIPTGNGPAPPAPPGRSPSAWALGSTAGSGAVSTGWFVANEAAAGVWTLEAIDANGFVPGTFVFPYGPGVVPNGTPLTEPAATGFAGPALPDSYQSGLVWVPALDTTPGGVANIFLVTGSVIAPVAPTPLPAPIANTTLIHTVSAVNHTPTPPLPALPLAGTPWLGAIIPDQKTNSKADYGLFIVGY